MTERANLDEMTQFRTRKGLHIDRWIGRDIRQTEEGDFVHHSTGELLDQQESKEYEKYRQRFLKRCKPGGKADRLVRIVDKYLPDVADENRAHTARFPEKVHDKLRRARAIRRKIRARTENPDAGMTQQPEEPRGETTTPSRRRPPQKSPQPSGARGGGGNQKARGQTAAAA